MIHNGPICPDGPLTLDRPCRKEGGPVLRLYDPPIRTELVERVRREIAEGIYATPEKLEIALERLFDRLMED